jgi:hypothetical protein
LLAFNKTQGFRPAFIKPSCHLRGPWSWFVGVGDVLVILQTRAALVWRHHGHRVRVFSYNGHVVKVLCCSMILVIHTANKMRPVQQDCLCALVAGLLSPLTYGAGHFRRASCRRREYLHAPYIPDG